MPEFKLEFEVFCGKCGDGLCNESDTRESYRRAMPQVTVSPCPRCIAAARDEAWDEGYQSAMDEQSERADEEAVA